MKLLPNWTKVFFVYSNVQTVLSLSPSPTLSLSLSLSREDNKDFLPLFYFQCVSCVCVYPCRSVRHCGVCVRVPGTRVFRATRLHSHGDKPNPLLNPLWHPSFD
ncbi:unnamed protein product [Arctogadus glacialis]